MPWLPAAQIPAIWLSDFEKFRLVLKRCGPFGFDVWALTCLGLSARRSLLIW
jgi:hypothetical protein